VEWEPFRIIRLHITNCPVQRVTLTGCHQPPTIEYQWEWEEERGCPVCVQRFYVCCTWLIKHDWVHFSGALLYNGLAMRGSGAAIMVKVCRVGTLGCDTTGTLRCGYLDLSQLLRLEICGVDFTLQAMLMQ